MKPESPSKQCPELPLLSRRELIVGGIGIFLMSTLTGQIAYARAISAPHLDTREDLWRITQLPLAFADDGQSRVAYLLQSRIHRILVNPGSNVELALSALGKQEISPASITAIFFSSYNSGLFPGFAGQQGVAFSKAQIWLAQSEHAWNDSVFAALDAVNPVVSVRNTMSTFTSGQQIAPGLTLVDISGPTPGHAGLAVNTSRGEHIICGDLFDRVSLERPSHVSTHYVSPSRVIISRRSVLNRVENDTTRLLCNRI